jgi:hypothetical protein
MSDTPTIPGGAKGARHRRADAARGAAVGLTAGVVCGGVTGVGCGLLPALLWYPFVLVITCPLYGLAGAAIGGVAGAIAGAAGLAARSAWVAALTGCALALALGAGLGVWALQAGGATYPPVRGRIDPGATDEEEAALQRQSQIWSDEQAAGERGGLILFLVAPATLCALVATSGATGRVAWEARRKGTRPAAGVED